MKKLIKISTLLLLTLMLANCSKPFLYGQKQEMEPVVFSVNADLTKAKAASKRAVEFCGYMVQEESDDSIQTTWQPTTPDSHFVEYFGRQDHGTVGAYHKIVLSFETEGEKTKITVKSVAKSIVSNLKSTRLEEKKIASKISSFTLPADVKVTNVGLK